jgi:hypothetical protein
MACKLMFFVQVYEVTKKNKLVGGRSYEVASEEAAVIKARFMSEKAAGVVAFSQMVNIEIGDAEDPVLLAHFGRVPDEARSDAA